MVTSSSPPVGCSAMVGVEIGLGGAHLDDDADHLNHIGGVRLGDVAGCGPRRFL
jgi:hypothetical protein